MSGRGVNRNGWLNVIAAVVCAFFLGLAVADERTVSVVVNMAFVAINLTCWREITRTST